MVFKGKKINPFQDIIEEAITSLQNREIQNADKLITMKLSVFQRQIIRKLVHKRHLFNRHC